MIKVKEDAYLREATYDKDSNAIYIKVRNTKIVGTAWDHATVNMDVDAKGRLVGVEILL